MRMLSTGAQAVHKSVHKYKSKARLSVREPGLTLVAGAAFSGLDAPPSCASNTKEDLLIRSSERRLK